MTNQIYGLGTLRSYAVLIVLIGLTLLGGGGYLLTLHGSPYYVLCGFAVTASGVLLWQRQAKGAILYFLMLLATTAWAIWESGCDGWGLMARILAPAVLGLVLLLPAIRRPLVWQGTPWSGARIVVGILAALIVGAGLHAIVPPVTYANPLYQTGMTSQPVTQTPVPDSARDWADYGGDKAGSRFSTASQITPDNVGKLELAWRYKISDPGTRLEITPLKVDQTLYLCSSHNEIIAVNADDGKELWRFDPHVDLRTPGPSCRGVAYYKTPGATGACAERVITNTIDARLFAVDAHDGTPCADFGTNGEVSLFVGMGPSEPGYYHPTSAPTMVQGKIVLGGWVSDNQYWGEPSGVIRAFDAVTGKLAWAWDMGQPDRQMEPPEGETYTRSTPNAWGPMSADETLGLVYVPLGNPTPDYFGGYRRPFDEEYGSSVVALDVATGRPRWHFQTAHHDLWDYDIPAQPSLIDFPKDGKTVQAVLVPTKRGELFVLDRATGIPLYPVAEHPVPQTGGVPDDHLSPTQPYSDGMPSFRSAKLVEGDMWGITPLDQLWCRIKFHEARYEGPHTPPGLTTSIEMPGYIGGFEWAGVAIDRSRNLVITNTNAIPIRAQMLSREEADKRGLKRLTPENAQGFNVGAAEAQEKTPYGVVTALFMSPLYVPCQRPPYGRLSAIDMTTGKLVWTQVFGDARNLGPLGIKSHLPIPIGTINMGGAAVTQTGLTFIGATQDRNLRAYETATGKVLWQSPLPGDGNMTPITYTSSDGDRQFVVIGAAGSNGYQTTGPDYLVAYALPKTAAK